MKRGLFVLATLALSSALYAQQELTLEQARQLVADFNPQLLERASQNPTVHAWVGKMLSSYLESAPTDTLENRYTLAALARNFDNSVALQAALEQYQNALRYSQMGTNVSAAAEQAAQTLLTDIFAQVWAVSVQNKEALLSQYKQYYGEVERENSLPAMARQEKLQALQRATRMLRADLKQLRTNVGENLVSLARATLDKSKQQVAAEFAALQELSAAQASNLQIKANHKKPVAE